MPLVEAGGHHGAMTTTAVDHGDSSVSRRAAAALAEARSRWAGMAGRIGMGFAAAGFVLILIAWNGAAGLDYAQGQIPYLISGGVGGLGLIVFGAALVVAESSRRDRALLERRLEELTVALGRVGTPTGATPAGPGAPPPGAVVIAGRTSFHDPSCHLVEGRDESSYLSRTEAEESGLAPCRICTP